MSPGGCWHFGDRTFVSNAIPRHPIPVFGLVLRTVQNKLLCSPDTEDRPSRDTQGTNISGGAIVPSLRIALLFCSSSRRKDLRVWSKCRIRSTGTMILEFSSCRIGSYRSEAHSRLLFQKSTCEVRRIFSFCQNCHLLFLPRGREVHAAVCLPAGCSCRLGKIWTHMSLIEC